jgi:hypothetical protein
MDREGLNEWCLCFEVGFDVLEVSKPLYYSSIYLRKEGNG